MAVFDMDPRIASASRTDLDKADRMRMLNDEFRRDPKKGGVVLTDTVRGMQPRQLSALLRGISTFDGFTAEDDPYDERDFAAIMISGERYLWQIEYFDLNLRRRAPDPSDPAFTIRVMTVMRADEYRRQRRK